MKLPLTAKAETKQAILHNLGCEADDWLESAKVQQIELRGAKSVLKLAVKNIQGFAEIVTEDMDAGKLNDMGPLEIAAYAKLFITRCVDSLTNQGLHMATQEIAMGGEIAAYEKLVETLKEKHDKESLLIQSIRDAIEKGEVQIEDDGTVTQAEGSNGRRVSGVRPVQGIAAQRKAEAAAEKAKAEAVSAEEPQAETAPEEPKKKTRKKFKCGNCGKPGHTSRKCPDKKVLKET